MLGRLARWLRFLGCDTVYSNRGEIDLPGVAAREGRVILTRDTRLRSRLPSVRIIQIEDDRWKDQLCQVIREEGLAGFRRRLSRCSLCNTELQCRTAEQVEDRVPSYVLESREHFAECSSCRRVYWEGSHHEGILAELASVAEARPTRSSTEEGGDCGEGKGRH